MTPECKTANSSAELCYQSLALLQSTFTACLQSNEKYSAHVFPTAGKSNFFVTNEPFTLLIGHIAVLKLLSLTNNKVMSIVLSLAFHWYDYNMNCTLSQPLEVIVNSSLVWVPKFQLLNPACSVMTYHVDENLKLTGTDTRNVLVYAEMTSSFVALCESMNLRDFPFDSQTCNVQLSVDSNDAYHDGFAYEYLNQNNHANIMSGSSNSEWQITDARFTLSNSSYATDSYGISRAAFNLTVTLHRENYFYLMNLVAPATILASLATLSCVLPISVSPRIPLSASLVLSLYVLQGSIVQVLPQFNQDNEPRIVRAFLVAFIISVLSLTQGIVLYTAHVLAPDLALKTHLRVAKAFKLCCSCIRKRCRQRDACEDQQPVVMESSSSDCEVDQVCQESCIDIDAKEQGDEAEAATGLEPAAAYLSLIAKAVLHLAEASKKQQRLAEEAKRQEARRARAEHAWRLFDTVANGASTLVGAVLVFYYYGLYFNHLV